ncbi:LuxR C-terminal-related transcriptional regulator [Desertihabitans aurantiacus]|uniref:LuxR C-terminal-related transcriptional regulator n=1 Tax=Desertihabitans aurantiacus TaxID=2282477 RepID=UPI0013009CB7|nr:LuxR C-terminal-related transcriptional regulator [Desertihabitans aurantiacus]
MPPVPDPHVVRPRLHALIEHAVERPVTLLRAPAGFGKTTAAASWLRSRGARSATRWVQLEAHSADRTVQALAEERGEDGDAAVVVVDQLHRLPTPGLVEPLVARILSADRARLVLITRTAPALPLGLLRSRGVLTEIADRQLAFSEEEYRALLRLCGHDPDELGDTAAPVACTHGWSAAMRLLAEHHGDDRAAHQLTVLLDDYVRTEVLGPLEPDQRALLGDLAALDVLTPESAAGVSGRPDAWSRLSELALSGVPVRWLDAGTVELNPVLRRALTARLPGGATPQGRQHGRRVVEWLRSSGQGLAAVERLLADGDEDTAIATLGEELLPRLHSDTAVLDALLDRLSHLPDWRVAMMRGYLRLAHIPDTDPATALSTVEALLTDTEGRLSPLQQAYLDAFRLKLDRCTNYRLGTAGPDTLGTEEPPAREPGDTVRLQHVATAALRSEQALWRLHHGQLEAAHTTARQAATLAGLARVPWLQGEARATDSFALALLGEYRQARESALAAFETAREGGEGEQAAVTLAHLAESWIRMEGSDLTGARQHLDRVSARPPRPDTTPLVVYLDVMLTALGDGREASDRVDAFRQGDPVLTPFQRSLITVAAFRADLLADRLEEAQEEVDLLEAIGFPGQQVAVDLTRARILARAGREDEAVELLRPYLHERPPLSVREAIGVMSTLTVAADRAGRADVAESARVRWHAACERVGLEVDRSRAARMMRRLLAAEIELSPAERHVLEHLDSDLLLATVAERLYISGNTLKTHLRHLYRKLGVNGREAAVERARTLGLL